MFDLILASLAFVGSHLALSHGQIRRGLIVRLGLWPHRGLYSLVSVATFGWMIGAYLQAPVEVMYRAPFFIRHVPLTVMMLASFFLVGGYTIANPSAVILEDLNRPATTPGILKITRAPVMWGVGLFAFSHMLVNGDQASWVFFGALAVLAIGGGWHLDQRKTRDGTAEWLALRAQSSFIPFAALASGRTSLRPGDLGWWRGVLAVVLYGGLMAAHSGVIGVSPLPLPE